MGTEAAKVGYRAKLVCFVAREKHYNKLITFNVIIDTSKSLIKDLPVTNLEPFPPSSIQNPKV